MDAFPASEQVLQGFATEAIDNPRRRQTFLSALKWFGIVRKADEKREQMIALAHRGINPFDLETVPGNFHGLYPELSFSVLFEPKSSNQLQRAAAVCHVALEYRAWLLQDSNPEGMSRHLNLFGRAVNAQRIGFRWQKQVVDCSTSRHIVVAINGAYYALDVLDSTGDIADVHEIHEQLKAMALLEKGRRGGLSYGALTAVVTRETQTLFDSCPSLDPAIQAIDEALFLLSLDSHEVANDDQSCGAAIHGGWGEGRDYRKALQLIVLANGRSGATFNLLAEVEGVTAAQFSARINDRSQACEASTVPHPSAPRFAPLDLEPVRKAVSAKTVAAIVRSINAHHCVVQQIRRIDGIGSRAIKALGVSPDAFFHAAAHLAYLERFGKAPAIHNFVDVRTLKFGSISRYLTTTPEMLTFLRDQTKSNLLNAFKAHKDKTARVKAGDHPMHHVFHYLFSTPSLMMLPALLLFWLFVPNIVTRYFSPDIWASNIPALKGLSCLGRFGMRFTYARKHCLAGHFLLFPEHVEICFASKEDALLQTWQFHHALRDSMENTRKILTSD